MRHKVTKTLTFKLQQEKMQHQVLILLYFFALTLASFSHSGYKNPQIPNSQQSFLPTEIIGMCNL